MPNSFDISLLKRGTRLASMALLCVLAACGASKREVELSETSWHTYVLMEGKDPDLLVGEDWNKLFQIVQNSQLTSDSLEEAFNELFRYAETPERRQALLQYLEKPGNNGNVACMRIEARYYMYAATDAAEQGVTNDLSAYLPKWIALSRKAAEMGDSESMAMLAAGLIYENPHESSHRVEAIRWLTRASFLGNENAKSYLEMLTADNKDNQAAR